jgi:hypothetical protein
MDCQKDNYVYYHLEGLYLGKLDSAVTLDTLSFDDLRSHFYCVVKDEENDSMCALTEYHYPQGLYLNSTTKITSELLEKNDESVFRAAYYHEIKLLFYLEIKSERPEQDLYLSTDISFNDFRRFIEKDTTLVFSRFFYPKI